MLETVCGLGSRVSSHALCAAQNCLEINDLEIVLSMYKPSFHYRGRKNGLSVYEGKDLYCRLGVR